ncbi:hypothetical protein ABZ726_04705 [Streptomyces hundungensis]|uniref:hypothetical protein n=1 Tax=Streptomyces hundungensis TaxID=1077946 RepID=UPI0033FEBE02
MRSFLASSIGVAAVAALAVPLASTAPVAAASAVASPASAELAGSTQSLPMGPLPDTDRAAGGAALCRGWIPVRVPGVGAYRGGRPRGRSAACAVVLFIP